MKLLIQIQSNIENANKAQTVFNDIKEKLEDIPDLKIRGEVIDAHKLDGGD